MVRPSKSTAGAAKTNTSSSGDIRAERKRAQNRISQQCLREMQLVRTRHLKFMASAIDTGDGGSSEDLGRSYQRLLSKHAQLLKENEKLTQAVLRMRKKLLSLSATSAAAAEDEIFEDLLGKDCDSSAFSEKSSPEVPSPEAGSAFRPPGSVSKPAIDFNANPATLVAEKLPDGDFFQLPVDRSSGQEGSWNAMQADFGAEFGFSMSDPLQLQYSNSIDENTNPFYQNGGPQLASENNENDSENQIMQAAPCATDAFHQRIEEVSFSPDTQMQSTLDLEDAAVFARTASVPRPTPGLSPRNDIFFVEHRYADDSKARVTFESLHFADAVRIVCGKYISMQRINGVHDDSTNNVFSRETWSTFQSGQGQDAKELVANDLTTSLASIAVDLLSTFASMTRYLYGIGAADVMEDVFRWRLNPTRANSARILEPFRPTPLQASTQHYPAAIDFVNWPKIRDQLIIHPLAYDLPSLLEDLVNHTVIDITEYRVAVNVFELFQDGIAAKEPEVRRTNELQVPIAARLESNGNVTHESIMKIINRRLEYCKSRNNDNDCASAIMMKDRIERRDFMSSINARNSNYQKSAMAMKYGLTDLTQWKLSREFGQKYPFLDCSGCKS